MPKPSAADWVFRGLRDSANARNLAGLNFDQAASASGIRHPASAMRMQGRALVRRPQDLIAQLTQAWLRLAR